MYAVSTNIKDVHVCQETGNDGQCYPETLRAKLKAERKTNLRSKYLHFYFLTP
jgi:hypothetical protein